MASINVEVRHLRAFVAVAETANFTRAAQQLLISQPSLSYTIRQLESYLGLSLFTRDTRTTVLTPAGEIFLREARAVLARLDEALERAERMAAGELGQLRVGYLIGAAVDHVPSILRAFARDYPKVQCNPVEYDFATPNAGLDTGETDVAIVRPPLDLPSPAADALVMRTLIREPRVACLSETHPFAERTSITAAELLDEPIVAAPGDNRWRDYWILSSLRETPAKVAYEAATFEAELQAVSLGRGPSIVPASAARFYARPGLRFVPISDLADCEVSVAFLKGGPQAAVNFANLAERIVGV